MNRRTAGVIPSLDGLRAISIGLVLLGHGIIPLGVGHSFLFRLAFQHSGLGVEIFFVISGYLITNLLLKEKAEFGSISLRLFYIRRALRILPAFLVYVGTVFVLSALGYIDVPSRLWIFVLTYTINFTPGLWDAGHWVVGHLWSLSVEEHFYFLWPLAVRFWSIRACVGIATVAIFTGILIRAVYVATGYQLVDPALRYATPFVLGPIAMGCLLAIAGPRVKRTMLQNPHWTGPAAMLLAILAILVLDTVDLGSLNRFRNIILDLLLTFVVARFVFQPTGLAADLLNSGPLISIGKLSYSLYLWQELFMNPFSGILICTFPWNAMAAFTAACGSYFLIETRFLSLRRHFRRAPAQAAAAVLYP
jgi:peptidoglycan/LPS O-acetylase OafA/YrhL